MNKKFSSTKQYIASEELIEAVNACIILEKPLLVKGEPGTGKTKLAEEIASIFKTDLISWHIKSTTKAQQGLYEYDVLWKSFISKKKPVLLIDEIDKADIEFPNDLLQELDRMEFYVYETDKLVKAQQRPIVIITSNNEKDLPDAFLRRCFFHYISFPDEKTLTEIVKVHYPLIKKNLLNFALNSFLQMRETPGLKKKPSTSELIDWLKLLVADDLDPKYFLEKNKTNILPPLYGALLKNEADVELFQKIAFMARAER